MERDDIKVFVHSPRIQVGKKMRRLTEDEMAEYLAQVNVSRDRSPDNENGQMDGRMDGLADTSSNEEST